MSALVALSRALGLGDAPDRILDDLERLYASLEAEIEARAAPFALPCKAGCDACCHESVFVSAPEFLAVARALLELPLQVRRALHAQMSALARKFEDELELLEYITPGPERDEVAARIKFRCPMLDKAGRCSVYAVRELNARTFGLCQDSLRNEPYGCELTHERLRVLPKARASLFDAREARRRLVDAVPGTERVHVYPWWFQKYGKWLVDG